MDRGMFLTRRGKRSPSNRLTGLLADLAPGSCARWQDCEGTVRELAGDLPDFDSVWLDALVQRRLLTPWQAEQLEREPCGRLRVGEWQLRQSLGQHTYLAYSHVKRSQQVLRRLPLSEETAGDGGERCIRAVEQLTGMLSGLTRPGLRPPRNLVLPTIAARENDELWLSSTWVAGWDFEELLVRGGRLPWQAVAEAGRELLAVLSWLESGGWIHGELVLRNLRLTPGGRVILTDAFSRRLSQARPSIGGPLSLRVCDGIAPELVGTSRPADIRSEMHAAGCLLWQLLTGRPPFTAAEPVRRLLKLRDHDVPDVRELVPECPEWMSRSLLSMTRRLPELRAARAAELAAVWSESSGGGFRNLRRIAAELPDRRQRRASAKLPRVQSQSGMRQAGKLLLGSLSAAVVLFFASRSELLPLSLERTPQGSQQIEVEQPVPSAADQLRATISEAIPLPEPDATGRIQLQAGHAYLSRPIRRRGLLQITAEGKCCAVILVPSGRPWILQADEVSLQNLQLQRAGVDVASEEPQAAGSGTQLTAIQTRDLRVEGCIIQAPSEADDYSGLAWYQPETGGGRISIRHSVFAGGGYGFAMNQPPDELSLEGVLLASRGGGLLCEISSAARSSFAVSLQNVTQRFGYSVADIVAHDNGAARLEAELNCNECAFQPRMAVVRVRPANGWTSADMLIRFAASSEGGGIPAVVSPNLEPAVYIDRSLGQAVSLPEAQVPDPQLLFAELEFAVSDAEKNGAAWTAAEVIDFDGPKLSTAMPGCSATKLPQPAELPEQ